jgi:hypothetical protein
MLVWILTLVVLGTELSILYFDPKWVLRLIGALLTHFGFFVLMCFALWSICISPIKNREGKNSKVLKRIFVVGGIIVFLSSVWGLEGTVKGTYWLLKDNKLVTVEGELRRQHFFFLENALTLEETGASYTFYFPQQRVKEGDRYTFKVLPKTNIVLEVLKQ